MKKINLTKMIKNNEIIPKDFRKKVLGVFNNPEFTSEFAWYIAKNSNLKILIIDADPLEPLINETLAIKDKINTKIEYDSFTNSSFNAAIEYITKNIKIHHEIFEKICVNHKNNKNLYILTGNDNLETFEYYPENCLIPLIDLAIQNFDIVFVNTSNSIYDSFTIDTMYRSDLMLFPFEIFSSSLKIIYTYMQYIKEKQEIPIEKNKIIAFNYNKQYNLGIDEIKAVVSNNYIGKIEYDQNRMISRNNFNCNYSKKIPNKILKDYYKICKKLNIPVTEKRKYILKGD